MGDCFRLNPRCSLLLEILVLTGGAGAGERDAEQTFLAIRILALAWPVVLVITLAVNPAAQAGTTGRLETKLRSGGPVPVKSESTKSAAPSAIIKSKDAKPVASSQQAPQPQGDPPLLLSDAWVWRCEPTALVAVWSPKALCEDFVALR